MHGFVLCALHLLTEHAHTPQGGAEQGGMRIFAPSQQQSVKDLPSQTRLKFRCHDAVVWRAGTRTWRVERRWQGDTSQACTLLRRSLLATAPAS